MLTNSLAWQMRQLCSTRLVSTAATVAAAETFACGLLEELHDSNDNDARRYRAIFEEEAGGEEATPEGIVMSHKCRVHNISNSFDQRDIERHETDK